MIQQHTIDLNGIRLDYVEAPGPGAPLLIVHGSTGSHTSFLPFIPTLAQHAHIYALDQRGHNGSTRVPGAYQLQDYGRDVATFIQEVIGERPWIAGHSLGGLVAVWVAAHFPDWVQGIFLEDPPLYLTHMPRLQQTGFYRYFEYLRNSLPEHHAHNGTVEEMVETVAQSPINDQGQTLLELAGPEAVRERAVQLHNLDPTTLDPVLAGQTMGPHAPDALLAEVQCPVRLLAGQYEAGGAMTTEDVSRTVARLARCEHTVFEGVGHMIHQDRADEYVEALVQFISTQPTVA